MLKKIIMSLILITILSTFSCEAPIESKSSIVTRIPQIGFNNQGVTRAVVPETMSTEEMNFFIYCPALTGFNESSETLSDGDDMEPQSFLDTTVTFTVNTFTNGENGIEEGIRFSGSLADGSGSMIIELDKSEKKYYFEENLFIDDPNKIIDSSHTNTSKTIIYMTSAGTINSDDSVYGTSLMSFYTVLSSGAEYIAVAPNCDLYLGKWDDSGLKGAGLSFLKSAGVVAEASYGTVNKPTDILSSSLIDDTVEYIKSYISSSPTFIDQYAIFYKTDNDQYPTEFLDGLWNGVEINSPATAKANLPSELWKSHSIIDTY